MKRRYILFRPTCENWPLLQDLDKSDQKETHAPVFKIRDLVFKNHVVFFQLIPLHFDVQLVITGGLTAKSGKAQVVLDRFSASSDQSTYLGSYICFDVKSSGTLIPPKHQPVGFNFADRGDMLQLQWAPLFSLELCTAAFPQYTKLGLSGLTASTLAHRTNQAQNLHCGFYGIVWQTTKIRFNKRLIIFLLHCL